MPQHDAPPHSIEAEQYMLGCLLLDSMCLLTVPNVCKPADCWHERHRLIYEALLVVDKADIGLVGQWLKDHDMLDQCGGHAYLFKLAQDVPTTANADEYAQIVAEKARLRALRTAGLQITEAASEPHTTFAEALGKAADSILDLQRSDPGSEGLDLEEWVAMRRTGQDTRRLLTALQYLDDICYLRPGQVTVLGGSTSHGKTGVALQIVLNVIQTGQKCLLWSGEMDRLELYERMVANLAGVSLLLLQGGDLHASQWAAVENAARTLKKYPLTLDDRAGASIADIEIKARALKAREGLDWVVVDYLGLVRDLNDGGDDGERRDLRVGAALWRLKQLARDTDTHVLVLHQLSRKTDQRFTGRPRLSDLRDSGQIEQHANRVWLVYQPYRDEQQDASFRERCKGAIELLVPKQRQGPTGSIWLEYILSTQRVLTLPESKWPQYPEIRSRKGA